MLQNYADYECEINECIVFIISQQKVDTLTYGNKNQQMNIHILILLLFQHFAPRAMHKNNTKKKETKLLYYCIVKSSLVLFNHMCFLSWTLNVLIFTEFSTFFLSRNSPYCSGINYFFSSDQKHKQSTFVTLNEVPISSWVELKLYRDNKICLDTTILIFHI